VTSWGRSIEKKGNGRTQGRDADAKKRGRGRFGGGDIKGQGGGPFWEGASVKKGKGTKTHDCREEMMQTQDSCNGKRESWGRFFICRGPFKKRGDPGV